MYVYKFKKKKKKKKKPLIPFHTTQSLSRLLTFSSPTLAHPQPQTLILTPLTTKTPSLHHQSWHFPSNRALFHIPSITFNRDCSFCRPIIALDRSNHVRPPLIPFPSITCFSYLFGYRENVGKNKIKFTISIHREASFLLVRNLLVCVMFLVSCSSCRWSTIRTCKSRSWLSCR